MTRALHIAREGPGVDIDAAQRAAADFLSALGIAVDREDLRETPARMARAYAELFDARPLRLTTFANDGGYDELVLARAIPFRTVRGHYGDARQVLSELKALGIDYGDVTEGLESHGLAIFDASWRDLGDQLGTVLRQREAREESGE